jgi:hypothetical protein
VMRASACCSRAVYRLSEQKLHGSQIPRAAVDQRCLGPAQGVGAKPPRVKPDACHPVGKEASILAGCHRPIAPTTPSEQILTWPLAGLLQEVVNGMPGLIRQLEFDWSPGLLLPDDRTIDRIAIRSDIFDPQGDDVATTQLAVDRKIEKGKVAGLSFDQEPGSDRPDLVWPQRRFGPDQLALVPGCAASFSGEAVFVRHDRTARFMRHRACVSDAQIMSAFRACGRGVSLGRLRSAANDRKRTSLDRTSAFKLKKREDCNRRFERC